MKTFLRKLKSFAITMLIVNLVFANAAFGQAVGDYRTQGSGGNWGTLASWQRLNALPATWATPTVGQGYPGQNDVPGTVTILNNDDITLNVSPANSIGSLVLQGGGDANALTFSGSNSLTAGDITINAGTGSGDDKTISVGGGSLSCSSVTMAVTLSDAITSFLTVSTGSITVTGNITMNDADVDRNIVRITSSGTINIAGNITGGNLTTVANSTVNYNGAAQNIRNVTYGGNLMSSGSGTKTLSGTTIVTGLLTVVSGTTIDMANTNLNAGGLTGSGDLTHLTGTAGNRTLSITGSISPAEFTGVISDGTATSVLLNKSGSGTLILEGLNTYTGSTTIAAGTISINSLQNVNGGASSLGAPITTGNGTIILASSTSTLRYTGSGHSSDRVIQTENDDSDIDASGSGALTLTGGVVSNGAGSDDLVLTGTGTGIINSVINTAGGALDKTGSGTWALTGLNTYTGITTISNGTLSINTIQNVSGGASSLGAPTSAANGTINIGGTGLLLYTGTGHATNRIISATADGAAIDASGSGTLILNGNINSTGDDIELTGSGAAEANGVIALGAATVTKNGSGTWTLAGTNTYTSTTIINTGILVAANTQALGTTAGAVNLNGGTLDLATNASVLAYNVVVGGDATIITNRATAGAGITHTMGTLSIGLFQLNSNYGANVTPATKAGLTFGTTTLNGAGAGRIFQVANDVDLTLGALTGNNPFTKQGDGLMILNTASARTGGTVTINTGSVRLGVANALGTITVPVVMNAGSGLNLAINTTVNAYPVTINGNAIIVSNRSTAGAGITHTLGTLSIGNSTLTVLFGDNINDSNAGLTFGATTFIESTPVFDAFSGGITITLGALSGDFAFNKAGAGRLNLNTASARTGGTATLLDGTMSLGAVNAIGTVGVPLQINGGTLDLATATTVNAYNTTIGGDATIVSNKNAAGAGITHILGTLSIGANLLNINQGANVTSGTAAIQFGNFTMTGAPTLSPNTANLLMAGTATGAFKLTKAGAGTLQKTTTAWTLDSDFEMTAGIFDATTQNTTILGNWINNGGTLAASGASTLIFNGSAVQNIGGTSATTFHHLTIDNVSGVVLNNNENVNGLITMTNGNLTITTGNTLTIENGSAIFSGGFSSSKHIITQVNYTTGAKGFLRVNNMTGSAPYLFPVGDGTNYLPVTLTPSDAVVANNTYSVCSFEGLTVNGEPNGTPFTIPQKHNTVDAVWTVNYNGPGSPTAAAADMTVGWPESLEGINFTGYPGLIIGIAHYGTSWGPAVGIGDNTANTATRTGITQFSPFGVGKIDPAGGTLAIKIIYFNGSKGNNVNNLYWQAECTSSFAKFDLERSTDGVNFASITVVTATQARCASPFSYNDYTAPSGNVYYRIRIIDADGKVTYSAIVKLGSPVKTIELAGFMPNPVSNVAQLKINTTKADVVNLVVIALDGRILQRTTVNLQPGSSIINMDMTTLPAGAYMLKGIFSDGESNAIKFIKQ